MAQKKKYWEGWGFRDLIKVVLTGRPKQRDLAFKEISSTFSDSQIDKIGATKIEIYLPEHEIKNINSMASLFGMKVQYATGGAVPTESYKTGGRPPMSVAEIILQQIGGMNRVVMMTGAYNFGAGSNYLAFKIKNRRANYIKITLNGKDLYDIEIGRIFGSKYNVVKSYNDVYFDQLIPLLEEGTGMYFRFAKGGAVKKKETTDGTLLAPNGKPSNLTPEQYKLVRTPEFKRWFGDWENDPANASKVVDSNGEPLVVYHGSQSKFSVFDKTKGGQSNTMASVGYWFTPIQEFAINFAENVWYGDKEFTVYEAFLSLKNPKIYTKAVDNSEKIKILSEKLFQLKNEVDYLMKKWRNDFQDYQVFSYATQGMINPSNMNNYLRTENSVEVIQDGLKYNDIQLEISEIRNKINDLRYSDSYEKFRTDVHKIEGGNAETANTGGLGMALKYFKQTIDKYRQSLTEQGYDGIIIEKTRFDSSEAGGANDQFVAFESNQVKLADGTNTAFDSNSPDIRFGAGGKVLSSKRHLPNVRGGWTKEKIIKYFKSFSSDRVGTMTLLKYISEFDNWEQFKDHIYYHGTQSYIEKGLKPSITMSEREIERIGGGGYGQRYFGISLTKRKRTAERFSGMSSGVTIYPVILKRDAKIIERTDLQDAADIEDIIVELYEQGVDAVWIGGGEEELVVVNPYSILLYPRGREYHSAFGGYKSIPLTDEKIKEIYDNSKLMFDKYSEEYSTKQTKEERESFINALPSIQFDKGGSLEILLAPNGKPSNLTPEQYKLVRTPEFKRWFGDWENDPENASKVVDSNGEPLVVYHGTKKVFTMFFEKKYLGSEWNALNFFTTNYYTTLRDYDGWITYPCFIKIINPLKKLSGTPESSIGKEIIAGLKTDGFIFSGSALQKPLTDRETWIAVSKSNQIKLADKPIIKSTLKNKKFIEKVNTTFTESNNTFDGSNPDIRYMKGGQTDYSNYLTAIIGATYNGKVLIVKRGATAPWMPNKWSLVGGVVELNENPKDAIIRETQEEIGLTPTNVKFLNKVRTNDVGTIYYYHGILNSNQIVLDYENSHYAFISKQEIDEYEFIPHVKDFIQDLLNDTNKQNYEDGGLLAPNGKPSNLTPEQYKLVRTKAFKEWFGDWEKLTMTKLYDAGIDEISLKRLQDEVSKVVDENGEPLPVYHGSKADFTIFGEEQKLQGYLPEYRNLYEWKKNTNYFHKEKEYAETFGSKYGGKEFVCFLNIKNLVEAESVDDIEDIGYWKHIYDYYVNELNADGIFNSEGQFATLLSPNQIKLADGSNTTFDHENPDIRFKNGGLIAPNGNPSNLTPEQYRLVRTKAFKDWFGDWENDPENASKVVDYIDLNNQKKTYTDEPIVVYHGSTQEFNSFNKEYIGSREQGWFGEGFYFGESELQAKRYGQFVKTYFLKINNPFYFVGHQYDFANKFNVNYDDPNYSKIITKKLIDNGFDGIIIDSVWGKEYVVFEPNQIKLADGTNTTFDGNNPDIRFNGGGLIDKDEKGLKIIIQNVNKENKYKGAYKRIFEILEEDIAFYNPYGTIYEELKGSDFKIEITPIPENNKIQEIEKLPNVQIVNSFKKGGLIAPNGKPSNLTPEQFRLVRTPEFKAWFGDWENDPANASKVLDENGEPLVCNHSSREENIDIFYGGRVFRTKKNEVKPIWFTYKEFNEYASGDDIFQYQCFLKIKNLFDYSKIEDVNILKKSYIEKNGEMLPDYDFDMDWDAQEQFNLPAYIYEMGYDGYKFTDEYSIVVFNSNQIKLADGSNTTFDLNNPDIRFEEGGYLEEYANDPALEYKKGGRLSRKKKRGLKDDKMAFDLVEQPDVMLQGDMFSKGGKIETFSFVTAYTDENKKLFKLWKGKPTHKQVVRFFNKLKNSEGNNYTIVDSKIEPQPTSNFDRSMFIQYANRVAKEKYGSSIDDIDELIFRYNRDTFEVFPFEAELENDMNVIISSAEGVVYVEQIQE